MNENRLTPGQSCYLDAVRYSAAMLVVLHHGAAYFYRDFYYPFSRMHFLTNLGSVGVAIFFVLSGFVIAYSALSKSTYDFSHYVLDRFTRIYLVFFPAILLAVAVNLANLHIVGDNVPNMDMFTTGNFFATIGMLGGIVNGHAEIMPFIGPAWTINYEWWFYMLFGLAMLPMRGWTILKFIAFVAIAFLVSRLDSVMDLFLLWSAGAACAIVFLKVKNWKSVAIAILFSWLSIVVWLGPSEQIASEAIVVVAVLVGLRLCRDIVPSRQFSAATSRLAGFSFSLYLTHIMVIWAGRLVGDHFGLFSLSQNDERKFAAFLAVLLLTNIFARAFASLTEDRTANVRSVMRKVLRLAPSRPLPYS
jgi:peptidoglycan/LPS O-acetylase OafA/YrhL